MQDYSSFNARYNMGLNLENRFCRLAVHCAPPLSSEKSYVSNHQSIVPKNLYLILLP